MPDTAEFDDLVAELMLERPQIDPVFARELDAKAAAGFPRRRRRFSIPRPSLFVGAPVLATALIAAVIVIGAGGGDSGTPAHNAGGGSSASQSVAAAPEPQVKADAATETSADSAAAAAPTASLGTTTTEVAPLARSDSSGGAASSPALPTTVAPPSDGRLSKPTPNRVQEQSAAISLEAPADQVSSVGDQILQVTNQVGGFVESSSVRSTDGGDGGGTFSLRIPTDRLGDGLTRLSRLGHVTERTQGTQDITSLRNVARERVDELSALRTSLLKRLANADTDAETASLKAQLSDVNTQLGAARGDLAQVERRASFAQVSVTLSAKGKGSVVPVKDDKWGPKDALKDAGRVLETIASVLLVALSVLVPLALVIGVVVITRRYAGKRGRARALDAI
ncbi:MAG: hypothetical protein QOF76_3443 [Solirubrobacteraceae bacterium]|jgi:hypothetical protein|nr:hypothetical protein [Solirubrobacteraceae bacterium]